jgi:phage terminase large subunit-like protein
MTHIGRPLDDWQADIVIDTFGRRPDGLWAARDVVILVARQNGKGGVTEGQELPALFLFREPLILHSAHEFKTSSEAFRRIVDIIEGSDWLSRRVKAISRSKGDEGVELTRAAGGGRLRFVARSLGSGRGFSAGRLTFDEAYALTLGQFAAQTPTLATIDNPQITYTSTPPDEDTGPMPHDAMLPSVRKRGQAGDPRVAYYEWSPPRGHNPADRDLWYDCNPSLGVRIREEFLADQLAAFGAVGEAGLAKFSTEHLGDWPPDGDERWLVISEDAWAGACDPQSALPDKCHPAMAIDMTPDRAMTSIGLAGRRADGLRHIELIDHRPGSGWVVARAVALDAKHEPCAWVIDPSGPAGSLIPDLEAAGLTIVKLGAREATQACGQLFDGIAGALPDDPTERSPRDVRHRGQGPITAAVAGATKRVLVGAWAWNRTSPTVVISPLVCLTNALFGLAVHGGKASAALVPLFSRG